jgi:hypothetical protein
MNDRSREETGEPAVSQRASSAAKQRKDGRKVAALLVLGGAAVLLGLYLVLLAHGPGKTTSTTFVGPATMTKPGPGSRTSTVTGTATTVTSVPGRPQRGSDTIDAALLGAGSVLVLCAIFYRRIVKITIAGTEIDLSPAESALRDSTVKDALATAQETPDDELGSRGAPLRLELRDRAKIDPQGAVAEFLPELDGRLMRLEEQTLEDPSPADERRLGDVWTIRRLVEVGALQAKTADFCIAVLTAVSKLKAGATATTDDWRQLFELLGATWTVLSPPLLFRARVEHELQARGYQVDRALDPPRGELMDLFVSNRRGGQTLRVATSAAMNLNHVWLDKELWRFSNTDHSGPKLIVVPTLTRSLGGLQQDALRTKPKSSGPTATYGLLSMSKPTEEAPTRLVVRTAPTNDLAVWTLGALRAEIDVRGASDGHLPAIDTLAAPTSAPTFNVSWPGSA